VPTTRVRNAAIVLLVLLTHIALAASAQWMTSESAAQKHVDAVSQATTKAAAKDARDLLANSWTCFRRTLSLDAVPAAAKARIAVDSHYWLWINGKLVVWEGGLKRGPNRTDSYVDTVDLAPHLKPGKNTIALLTWYFGKEGFSHLSSGMPGVYFDCDALTADAKAGGDWKSIAHPAFGETGKPQPNYRLPESNVHFDAGKDLGDWMGESFDDSSWPAAKKLGEPPAKPWGALHDRPIPLFKFSGLNDYTNAADLPQGSDGKPIVAKLPYDAQVTPYLKIDAPAGLTIDMRTDSYMTGGEASVRSEYVTKAGVQEFETPAWMSGHEVRYTIPAGVKLLALKYRESGYDTDFAGAFHCDDEFFNTLWTKSRRTLYVNMRETYFDCPDRERAQWWGDIVIDVGQAFYTLDRRSDLLARKGLRELMAWQRPNGTLFAPIPAGNWDRELPMQMLATCGWFGAWNYYRNTGDVDTIKSIYPAVKRYVAVWKLGPDGLVIHRPGEWDWLDWGQNIDVPPLDNAWYFLALKSAAEMAKLAGANEDVTGYEKQMESIRTKYDAAFWHGDEYRSKDYKGDTDDRANAMAVLTGLAPESRFEGVRNVLRTHHNASPGMEKYILETQCRMGDVEDAQERMKLRYKPMVDSSLTTLWEFWDLSGSYNHPWAGGALAVLPQNIAGIAPTSVAWETFDVRPRLGTLNAIDVTVPSVKGPIAVSIRRSPANVSVDLDAPAGTKSHVVLPVDGMKLAPGTPVEFNAGPGKSHFEANSQ
jgi:alpha-L-rhamnosidase